MADDSKDKVTPPAQAAEVPATREYFFPAYGKTISATSREEAETKLAELLKKEDKN